MSKPKNETPEHREERLRKDRERRAAKRKMEKDLQATVEKAPETDMQASLKVTYSNEKQPGQLLSDAAFHDYLSRQRQKG